MATPYETIAGLAEKRAGKTPGGVAFIEADGRTITFTQILSEGQALARGLTSLGLQQGETISVQLPNWREAVAINLAAAMLGLRINPITPIYRSAELRMILEDAGSKLIFIPYQFRSQEFARILADLRADLPVLEHVITVRHDPVPGTSYEWLLSQFADGPPIEPAYPQPDAPKLLLYTSGTTGRAKGAIHTHASIRASLDTSAAYWGISQADKILMASPVTHVTGYLFGLEMPFLTGSPAVLMERWEPAMALDLIERFRLTVMFGATPFLKELLDEAETKGNRVPSLRMFPCGGASVSPELIRRASRVMERCKAFRIYGATEAPNVTKGFLSDAESDLGAVTDGRIVGYEVKVVNAEDREVPPGSEGEIRVRGPAMFAGYSSIEETDKAFDDEGYFRTGDLAVRHGDAITVTGRLKDLIIRGGENLSPVEIENALMRHPSIAEAAVVAMPHPRLGEGVAAFLMGAPDMPELNVQEIADFLDGQGLARQKFPEMVSYVEDFPRTASGKIRKDMLRASLEARACTE